MGPWRFIREQSQPLLDPTSRELRYVGRAESASPAAGSGKRRQQEQAEIVNDALTPGAISRRGECCHCEAREEGASPASIVPPVKISTNWHKNSLLV